MLNIGNIGNRSGNTCTFMGYGHSQLNSTKKAPTVMNRQIAVIAVLIMSFFVSLVSAVAQPWSEINNYSYDRTVYGLYKNLLTTSYKVTSRKEIEFTAGGGSISYFQGIYPLSTNVTRIQVCETDENGYRLVRTEEVFYNKYAPDGRQTNLVDNPGGPYYLSPFDQWMIGTLVRTTETHKLVDTGDFSIHYDNKNSLSPWVIKHYMSGNKGDYNTLLRVGPKGSGTFSPSLNDAKKETGSSYSHAYFTGFDWWVPWDEPAFAASGNTTTYKTTNKRSTRKGLKYAPYPIQSPSDLHWAFTPRVPSVEP